MGVQFDNVLLENNIFSTKGVVNFINADTSVGVSKLLLKHNVYYSYSGITILNMAKRKFSTINAWLGANKQQEDNGQSLMQVNQPFYRGKQVPCKSF